MSLALGVALMTGVQLAEARTVTGSGDFVVAASALPAPSPVVPAHASAAPTSSPPTPAMSSADASPTPPASALTTPSSAIPTAPSSGAEPAAPSPESPAPTTPAPTTPAPVPAGIPIGFALPRLDVQAPIDPVGQMDGELEVPEDIRRLGWWTGSAAAGGASGTTVLDGHIDSPQGRGVFFHLQEVEPDDQVVLTVAGGATVTYRVTERRSYHKADGLPAEVFASTEQPKLVLITCGGRYDFAQASYDDNIVVIAVPA